LEMSRCPLCDTSFGETPPQAAGGIVGAVFARVRLDFACPTCGWQTPLPPSLAEHVECQGCKKSQEMPSPQWHSALELAHAVADLCLWRGPVVPENEYQTVGKQRCFAEWRGGLLQVHASPGHPLCAACHAPLEMRRGPEGEWLAHCAQCGARAECYLPERADFVAPSLLTVVDVSVHGQAVAIQCPRCGGPLSVDDNAELATCQYCGTTSRVQRRAQPDGFWVLLRGASDARRQLERAVAARTRRVPARGLDPDTDAGERWNPRAEERRAVRAVLAVWGACLLLTALILLFLFWPRRGTWDEAQTLRCTDETITIEDESVSLPSGIPRNKRGPPGCDENALLCPLIYAMGGCELKVVNSRLHAPMVIEANANAHVVIQDSVVDGIIWSAGDAQVVFRNSTLNGRVIRRGNSRVTGVPASGEE